MFIPKKPYANAESIADGEYTAKIERIRMTKDNDSVMFICAITTEGFNNMEITGFARANWNKPSGRTTANLLQWCKNLGAELVEGQEDQFDIETLVGKECRVIVQSYVKKTDGSSAVKVSNILPFNKKPIPNPMGQTRGLHVGGQQPAQQQVPQPMGYAPMQQQQPMQQPVQQAPIATPANNDSDNLW